MLVQTKCCDHDRPSSDVVLYCAGLGMVRGRILDVDNRGVFVDTGRVRLPVQLAVQAYVSQGRRRRGLRFSATTESCEGREPGVRFMRLESDDLEELSSLACNDACY